MANLHIRALLSFNMMSFVIVHVQGRPRIERDATDDGDFSVVTTQYGKVRGRRLHIDDSIDLEIYLGVRYAKAPVGDLRFARPQPPTPWTDTKDALKHGDKCVGRIIPEDPVLENVPFGEDCLFLDIYTIRYKDNITSKVPTMMFTHGGGYYGGSGAKYNFTNVALKGVTVISVSYRLDIFGFLSTQDDVIPGNFGLLDNIMALDWIRNNIEAFGGDPELITVFGGSSGAVTGSVMTLSPLSRGKFTRAIMQSGAASCFWAVHVPGQTIAVPRDIARLVGTRVNCSLPQEDFSGDLLECLRAIPVDVLLNESVYIQEQIYRGNAIFIPVVETTFGVIPDTPYNLLRRTEELEHIPTMYGYTHEDGSFMVSDPDNDGVTLDEFRMSIRTSVAAYYPSDEHDEVYNKALTTYLPEDPSGLSKFDLRDRLIRASTGAFSIGRMIREARLFSKAGRGDDSEMYVFDFNHRPSYSLWPAWMGVAHADEKGFVLGLPVGPDPFKYPTYDADDELVADFVTTTWTNFAKYGDPTPSPVQNVTWQQFKPGSDEKIMVIQPSPLVKDFDRDKDVQVWASTPGQSTPGQSTPTSSNTDITTGDPGGNVGSHCQAEMTVWMLCVLTWVYGLETILH